MANYLGYEFVDSAEVIIFNEDGSFDADTTDKLLQERLSKVENAVVPGFYGATLGGVVKTFSRGGSDVTGSLVSKAVHATAYGETICFYFDTLFYARRDDIEFLEDSCDERGGCQIAVAS